MTKKPRTSPPTQPFGIDFFKIREELKKAGHKIPPNLPGEIKAPPDEVSTQRKSLQEKAAKAAGLRETKFRATEIDVPASSIELFLEKKDEFGFYNFKSAVPSLELLADFNRFLRTHTIAIRFALLAYAKIPRGWLEQNGFIPNICKTPKDYAQAMLTALARDGYQLMLNTDAAISNYNLWVDVFEALKLGVEYKKLQTAEK